jgi:hypothetical protein
LDTIARARDALSALFKQWVASLAQVFEPSVNGREIFDDYVSRLEQARRLRTDLWAFREICHRAERAALRGSSDEVERAVGALRKFVGYFKDVSYQLLRYGDYDPFDRFINILNDNNCPANLFGFISIWNTSYACPNLLSRLAGIKHFHTRMDRLSPESFGGGPL